MEKLQKIKKELDQQKKQECTFKPNVNNYCPTESCAFQRLQHDAMMRKFKKEKAKRDIANEDIKECTSKPKINEKSKNKA